MKLYIPSRISKEAFARKAFTIFLSTMLVIPLVQAQDDLNVFQDNWVHFSDAPNSLYKHLASQAYDRLEQRKEEVSQLNSLEEWQEKQQSIKEQLARVLGPFPEKSPLNAQVIRTVEKEDYKVEHIVYESQPQFYVSSSLFIPNGIESKAPVVIYCSGHTEEGYRSSTYQHVILNLVKKGFIVFAFDPVGQGERLEYFDQEKGGSLVGGATKEHSYPGAQAFISGRSQAMYMIWDGIRAVDYLLTRKEVDPKRIGITGRSGGGTQSSYIAAVEERIYAAAPENYITTFTRLFETNGPQDAEQNFLHGIAEGLDQPDLLIVRAPKPSLMITTTRDIFSIQGAREAAEEVSRIYEAYGKEENFNRVEDDAGHASTLKNREAMYAFFQDHLDNPGDANDEETTLLNDEEIQVTSTGQISTSFEGETVFGLNKKETEKMISERKDSRGNSTTGLSRAVEAAKKLSGYEEPKTVGDPVLTGRFQREGYVLEKYYLEGEGNYVVPYLLLVPEKSNQKALIYLHPSGKSSEASEGGEMEWFVKKGFTVLAPDLIGIGEAGAGEFSGDSNFQGNSYNLWFASLQIGRSIVGIQAGDVVRFTQLFQNNSDVNEIFGLAKKEMAPVLLHAASFDPSISRIALVEPLISYQSLVTNWLYNPSFIQTSVPAALTGYDLPDLMANLAPRKLLLVNIQDGTGSSVDRNDFQEDLSFIRSAYQKENMEGQLKILNKEAMNKSFDFYQEWIE
jgi:hypothetical protein